MLPCGHGSKLRPASGLGWDAYPIKLGRMGARGRAKTHPASLRRRGGRSFSLAPTAARLGVRATRLRAQAAPTSPMGQCAILRSWFVLLTAEGRLRVSLACLIQHARACLVPFSVDVSETLRLNACAALHGSKSKNSKNIEAYNSQILEL